MTTWVIQEVDGKMRRPLG